MFFVYFFWQEAAVVPPNVAFAVRNNPGCWDYVNVNAEDLSVTNISATDYLKLKETIFDENWYIYFLLPEYRYGILI